MPIILNDIDQKAVKRIVEWSTMDDRPAIFIHSEGGCPSCAVAIHDLINMCDGSVHVVGSCFSSALFVLAGSSYRTCGPHAHFMAHDIQHTWAGTDRDLKGYAKYCRTFKAQLVDMMAKVTKLNERQWRSMLSGPEDYFNADTALKIGLIQGIT